MIAGNVDEVKARLALASGFAMPTRCDFGFSLIIAEQFPGISQRVTGDLVTAEQAGQLIQTPLRGERQHAGFSG